MKKFLKTFFCILLCLAMIGCNGKTNEDIEQSINENQYEILFYDLFNTIVITKDSHWFKLEKNNLEYINHSICSYSLNLENNNLVDIETKESITDENSKKEMIESSNTAFDQLKVNKSQLASFMNDKLSETRNRYNSAASKEKLLMVFPKYEDEINKLSDNEIESYLKYYIEDTDQSYDSIKDKLFMDSLPNKAKDIIENLKTKDSNATAFDLDDYQVADDEKNNGKIIFYPVEYGTNDEAVISIQYNSKSCTAVTVFTKNEPSDSEDLIILMAAVASCVDEDLDALNALNTVEKSIGKVYKFNGYTYCVTATNDGTYGLTIKI